MKTCPKAIPPRYVMAYHGTPNKKKVLREGIKVGRDTRDNNEGGERGTFLTSDYGEAEDYGDVVTVVLPRSMVSREEHASDFEVGNSTIWYVVKKKIPKKYLCVNKI